MIILQKQHRDAILRHGETEYPYECCGLLLGGMDGDRKTVGEVYPISNARDEAVKRNRFLITADEFLRGERHAAQQGSDILGIYHSHPDHPARASVYDRDHAWPVYSYVIVSVVHGKAGDLLSWVLENDRSEFQSEIILEGETQCL